MVTKIQLLLLLFFVAIIGVALIYFFKSIVKEIDRIETQNKLSEEYSNESESSFNELNGITSQEFVSV
jgi:SNF family Na+-dependent transporter